MNSPAFMQSESWAAEIEAVRRFIRAMRKADAELMQELLDETIALFEAGDPELLPLTSLNLGMQVVLWKKIKALIN